MEKPKRCYIRLEWMETVSFLTPEQRCMFYEACIRYVCDEVTPTFDDKEVNMAFKMVAPQLERDAVMYEKKVKKNTEKHSDRAEFEEHPPKNQQKLKNTSEDVSPNVNNIHIHINNSKENYFFTLGEADREKIISFEFFRRGCIDFVGEAKKYINYYAARDWLDKGGNKITNPVAGARAWTIKGEHTPWFEKVRQKWCSCLEILSSYEMCYMTDFVRQEIKDDPETGKKVWHLYLRSVDLMKDIEEKHLKEFTIYAKTIGVVTMQYHLEQQQL